MESIGRYNSLHAVVLGVFLVLRPLKGKETMTPVSLLCLGWSMAESCGRLSYLLSRPVLHWLRTLHLLLNCLHCLLSVVHQHFHRPHCSPSLLLNFCDLLLANHGVLSFCSLPSSALSLQQQILTARRSFLFLLLVPLLLSSSLISLSFAVHL